MSKAWNEPIHRASIEWKLDEKTDQYVCSTRVATCRFCSYLGDQMYMVANIPLHHCKLAELIGEDSGNAPVDPLNNYCDHWYLNPIEDPQKYLDFMFQCELTKLSMKEAYRNELGLVEFPKD